MSGRLDREELRAFAETVAPATLDDARAMRRAVTEFALALDELDRVTLPSGFDVSVRTAGEGVDAICIHEPIERCQRIATESSLGGRAVMTAVSGFRVEGVGWVVGWSPGAHEPYLYGSAGPTTPITDVAQGRLGTFLAAPAAQPNPPTTPDEIATQIVFDHGDQAIYGSGVPSDADLLD